MMSVRSPQLRHALTSTTDDLLVLDLDGIASQYDELARELPGVSVRFAIKACPIDEVIERLAKHGAGADAASVHEITQALMAGVPVHAIHFGNTVKSDRAIAEAFQLGVRDFATDTITDVEALGRNAPGSRVFCRIAASGDGALWGLSRKFGCTEEEAVRILCHAQDRGLTPAGLSVHVGSQQMTASAWDEAFQKIESTLRRLRSRNIDLLYINLGGGLPASGYQDRSGKRLIPPRTQIFSSIRAGMARLRQAQETELQFWVEPGRYLVADHGVLRTHVIRLAEREHQSGEKLHWLYLSCGKFSGMYEMDALNYPLVFPGQESSPQVNAVVAGPTCDSDDAYSPDHSLTPAPQHASSGDPVWVLSAGAYSTSYMTQGFNGFPPTPYVCVGADAGISSSALLEERCDVVGGR